MSIWSSLFGGASTGTAPTSNTASGSTGALGGLLTPGTAASTAASTAAMQQIYMQQLQHSQQGPYLPRGQLIPGEWREAQPLPTIREKVETEFVRPMYAAEFNNILMRYKAETSMSLTGIIGEISILNRIVLDWDNDSLGMELAHHVRKENLRKNI